MDLSPMRGIPHPTEYEDPYIDAGADWIAFLETAAEYRYSPFAAVAAGADALTVVWTEPLDHVLRAGLPLRYREAQYDPWVYGVIDAVTPNYHTPPGSIDVAGAPIPSLAVSQVEVGGAAQLAHRHLFYPGAFTAGGDALGLFSADSGRGEAFVWDGPPAYLVRMRARCGVPDSTGTVYICPIVNHVALSAPAWERMDTSNGGLGIAPGGVAIGTTGDTLDPHTYRVVAGDVIDVAVTTVTGTRDAENLTVEFTFALAGDQDQPCVGGAPQVLLTIVGMPPGETWQGLGNGVHILCPTAYTARRLSWYYSPTQYAQSVSESWQLAATASPSDMLALVAGHWDAEPGSTHAATSRVAMGFGTSNDAASFTTGILGSIQDRLFVSFTLGAATFTLQRGLGPWMAP